MIRNIQLYHAGKYICVVDTDVESLSSVAVLIVKGKENLLSTLQSLIKPVKIASVYILEKKIKTNKGKKTKMPKGLILGGFSKDKRLHNLSRIH